MQEIPAIIERVRRASSSSQRLDIVLDKAYAKIDVGPGQLFLARTTLALDPLLREPWTPVTHDQSLLTVELPLGKEYAPGQYVNLIGPLGKPIPLRETMRALLLVAIDATPASFLLLASTALARGMSVTLALIGGAQHYALEMLPPEVEINRAESLAAWDQCEQALKWADQVVAVAPPPYDTEHYTQLMDACLTARMEIPEGFCYGLFQPPMPCGIGACSACLISCKGEDVPACLEGPAFDLVTTLRRESAR